jgi:hypothetical protein
MTAFALECPAFRKGGLILGGVRQRLAIKFAVLVVAFLLRLRHLFRRPIVADKSNTAGEQRDEHRER